MYAYLFLTTIFILPEARTAANIAFYFGVTSFRRIFMQQQLLLIVVVVVVVVVVAAAAAAAAAAEAVLC